MRMPRNFQRTYQKKEALWRLIYPMLYSWLMHKCSTKSNAQCLTQGRVTYPKDRDGRGRMDALGNLVFGADHTTLKAPPPPLLQNMLILQKRY